jgi:hypothetical protein
MNTCTILERKFWCIVTMRLQSKVLNSGFTKDEFMQCCLREICFIAATHEFEIRAKHIAGKENRIALK